MPRNSSGSQRRWSWILIDPTTGQRSIQQVGGKLKWVSVRLVSVDADELEQVSESPGQINDARALSKCRETDFDERGKYG